MGLARKSLSIFHRDIFLFVVKLVAGGLVARGLGPSQMGIVALFLLIPTYAESFGRFRLDDAAVYVLGRGKLRLAQAIFMTNVVAIGTASMIAALIFVNSDSLRLHLIPENLQNYPIMLAIVCGVIFLKFLHLNNLKLHLYREDVRTINRIVLIDSLVSSGFSLILVYVFNGGPAEVLCAGLFGQICAVSFSIVKLFHIVRPSPYLSVSIFIDMLRFGIPHYFGGVLANLQIYLTNLFSVLFLVPAQIAFFSLAKDRCQMVMTRVPEALNSLLFSRVSKIGKSEQAKELLCKSYRIVSFTLLMAGVIAALFIWPFIRIVYGREFLPAVIPFLIILPGVVLAESSSILVQWFTGTGRTSVIPKLLVIPIILQCSISWIAGKESGLIGLAIAFSFSQMTYALLCLLLFVSETGIAWRDLIFTRNDIKFLYSNIRKVGKIDD